MLDNEKVREEKKKILEGMIVATNCDDEDAPDEMKRIRTAISMLQQIDEVVENPNVRDWAFSDLPYQDRRALLNLFDKDELVRNLLNLAGELFNEKQNKVKKYATTKKI